MMQETERPRERRLSALIGSRDDDDPLAPIEEKIIGHDRQFLIDKDFSQRKVIGIHYPDFLGFRRHPRIAKRQSGTADTAYMGDVGDIELDLPIEPQDRPVKEAAASGGEVVELREYLRI